MNIRYRLHSFLSNGYRFSLLRSNTVVVHTDTHKLVVVDLMSIELENNEYRKQQYVFGSILT